MQVTIIPIVIGAFGTVIKGLLNLYNSKLAQMWTYNKSKLKESTGGRKRIKRRKVKQKGKKQHFLFFCVCVWPA